MREEIHSSFDLQTAFANAFGKKTLQVSRVLQVIRAELQLPQTRSHTQEEGRENAEMRLVRQRASVDTWLPAASLTMCENDGGASEH